MILPPLGNESVDGDRLAHPAQDSVPALGKINSSLVGPATFPKGPSYVAAV